MDGLVDQSSKEKEESNHRSNSAVSLIHHSLTITNKVIEYVARRGLIMADDDTESRGADSFWELKSQVQAGWVDHTHSSNT